MKLGAITIKKTDSKNGVKIKEKSLKFDGNPLVFE